MFDLTIVYTVLWIIILIITIVIIESKFTPIQSEVKNLHKFYSNFKFQRGVENDDEFEMPEMKYTCNAHTLRECSLNNASTLFGCKELTVKCVHFKEDVQFWENNKNVNIPKNMDSNTGYALSISESVKYCNPYHGNFVLVTLDDINNDYMLICECKNPGYINKDHLLGACEDVKICNGTVKDLNKDLLKMECICKDHEKNDIIDNIPVCKKIQIIEANDKYEDWSHLVDWGARSKLSIGIFNSTIKSNMKTKYLLDTCERSIFDGSVVRFARYDRYIKSCTVTDYGIPVRINLFATSSNDDDDDDDEMENVPFDGVLPSTLWQSLRFLDSIKNKRRLMNVNAQLPFYSNNKSLYINLPENLGFHSLSQVFISMDNVFFTSKCDITWPTYKCTIRDNYDHLEWGIPASYGQMLYPTFMWERGDFNKANNLNNDVKVTSSGLNYLPINYLETPLLQICGLMFGGSNNGLMSFKNSKDYNTHVKYLTLI